MKALSIQPEYAMPVLYGQKTVEYRSWRTDYRGDILICASSHRFSGAIDRHALCVVELVDIVPFGPQHLQAAMMDEMPPVSNGKTGFAWILKDVRLIKPFKQKGKLHTFEVKDSKIKILNKGISQAWCLQTFYYPLIYQDEKHFENHFFKREWDEVIKRKEFFDKRNGRIVPKNQKVKACFTAIGIE